MVTSFRERLGIRMAGVMISGASLVALTGCHAAAPASSDPWAAEFAAAYAATDSEFIRDVLADGEITSVELHEARELFLACVHDAGLHVGIWEDADGNWGTSVAGDWSEEDLAIEFACDDQWIGPIAQLHRITTLNPDNTDWDTLVAQCLVRRGLAPEGFTGRDYREISEYGLERITIGPDDSVEDAIAATADAPVIPRLLPSGVDLNESEEAWECRTDPRR